MVYKRDKNRFGAITVGDIRNVLHERDYDEIVYLDGFSFSLCEYPSGNLVIRTGDCKSDEEELI